SLPQIERAAQRVILPLHWVGMVPSADSRLTTWATQLTWRPWLVAAAHGHCVSIAAWTAHRAGSQSTAALATDAADTAIRRNAPSIRRKRMPYPLSAGRSVPGLVRAVDAIIVRAAIAHRRPTLRQRSPNIDAVVETSAGVA